MKALCLNRGTLSIQTIPKPALRPEHVLVKVRIAGICRTDLELVKGYMGFEGVPGHEFVGTVVAAGDSSWIGKRVCAEINYACNACAWCRKGLSRHCPDRTVMGILHQSGAFAQFLAVPYENLRAVPAGVPDRAAVFAEPLAAAFEILEQFQVRPDHKVAVIGDGKLGLLICKVLALTGCDLTLVGKHETKLALAAAWGIPLVTHGQTGAAQFDVVVEASGSPSGFADAMQYVKPRGTIILKSTYAGDLTLDAAPIVINEINILGSRCGQFEAALRALDKNLVSVTELIEEVFDFDNIIAAFARAEQPGTLKILINFDG